MFATFREVANFGINQTTVKYYCPVDGHVCVSRGNSLLSPDEQQRLLNFFKYLLALVGAL